MKITIYFKDGASYSSDKNVIRFKGVQIKDNEGIRLLASNSCNGDFISFNNGYDPSKVFVYPVRELESIEIEGAEKWL